MTISQLIDHYTAERIPSLGESTQRSYSACLETWIRPHLGSIQTAKCVQSDVQRLVRYMAEQGKARETQKQMVRVLHALWEWAADNDLILTRNPARKIAYSDRPAPQLRRAPTPEELSAIRSNLAEPYRLGFDLMAFCGLRLGEAAALTTEACDWARGVITVRESITQGRSRKSTKTGKSRQVPMGFLREKLESGFAMPPRRSLQAAVKRAFVRAGLDVNGFGPHCLRNFYTTYGSQFLSARDVQDNLGHSSAGMTQRYIAPAMAAREAAMNRMREMALGKA